VTTAPRSTLDAITRISTTTTALTPPSACSRRPSSRITGGRRTNPSSHSEWTNQRGPVRNSGRHRSRPPGSVAGVSSRGGPGAVPEIAHDLPTGRRCTGRHGAADDERPERESPGQTAYGDTRRKPPTPAGPTLEDQGAAHFQRPTALRLAVGAGRSGRPEPPLGYLDACWAMVRGLHRRRRAATPIQLRRRLPNLTTRVSLSRGRQP
jgi:hypothetical protein